MFSRLRRSGRQRPVDEAFAHCVRGFAQLAAVELGGLPPALSKVAHDLLKRPEQVSSELGRKLRERLRGYEQRP